MKNVIIILTTLSILIVALNSPPVLVGLVFIGITAYIVYNK